jgi:hypothetical protein
MVMQAMPFLHKFANRTMVASYRNYAQKIISKNYFVSAENKTKNSEKCTCNQKNNHN